MELPMRKHFVWIVGHSAVGKQSTIDALLERALHESTFVKDSSTNLQELFGIDLTNGGGQVEAVPRDGLTPYDVRLRKNIKVAASKCHCVLVKWQRHYRNICVRLAEERPDDEHTVIHLFREETEHLEGFIRKHGANWDGDIETTKREFYSQGKTNNGECSEFAGCDSLKFLRIMIKQGRYSHTP